MPQSVIIQTESATPVNARKAGSASDKAEGGGFSDHFNKQVRQDEATANKGTATDSKTAETGKDVAADGKNLPTEKPQSEGSAETDKSVSAKQSEDKAETPGNNSDNNQADDAGNKAPSAEEQKAAAAGVANAGQVGQPADAGLGNKRTNATAVSADKGAGEQSGMKSAHNAADINTQVKAGNQQSVVKTEAESVKASLLEPAQNNKKAVPNLAASLKELSKEQSGSPKIRADILNALQRQQGKEEISTNLRNLMAAQSQQQDAKTPSILLRPAATASVVDSPAHGQHTATALTGLASASGQPASAQTVSAQSGLSLPVQPSMQNPAWGQVMSSRVAWMAKEGIQEAELRMNPARLGPVEVKLHVQNDQASVTFLAQQSATRDALEQALPRLRESFAESGMQLTDAQVGEQEQQQEQSEQSGESQFFAQAPGPADDIDDETVESVSSGSEPEGLSLYA
jgi:flagellar hook-length control protein FliK